MRSLPRPSLTALAVVEQFVFFGIAVPGSMSKNVFQFDQSLEMFSDLAVSPSKRIPQLTLRESNMRSINLSRFRLLIDHVVNQDEQLPRLR